MEDFTSVRFMASSEELEAFSLSLSEVMDDIGVNEDVIIRRRRKSITTEIIQKLSYNLRNMKITKYFFGSLVEGTTTRAMNSDYDNLICFENFTVIQSLNQWKFGSSIISLLMVEDDMTPTGYCNLQLLENTAAKPATKPLTGFEFIIDKKGRVLLSNHIVNQYINGHNDYRHGPCWATIGESGFSDQDTALALACEWPPCALDWFDEQSNSGWPTNHMKAYCRDTPCFLVPVGKKGSPNEDAQWRISTSLAERCLMFNLNITQLRCYILIKMILKTHFKSYVNKELTSFMCKTILFHCVKKQNPKLWQERHLFLCLLICLIDLYQSAITESCSHFFIRSNNLMEKTFSAKSKMHITCCLHEIILNLQNKILDIEFDGLNTKLQCSLEQNMFVDMCSNEVCESLAYKFRKERFVYHLGISGLISVEMGEFLSELHLLYLYKVENCASDELELLYKIQETIIKPFGQVEDLDLETRKIAAPIAIAISQVLILHENRPVNGNLTDVHRFLFHSLKTLVNLYRQDISKLEKLACLTLTRLVCAQLIFIQVCLDLENCSKHSLDICPEIFQSFDLPIDVDVASYKLKMSSVLYCTGHVLKANQTLGEVEKRYELDKVEPICGCHPFATPTRRKMFFEISYFQNEQAFKEIAAFCVRFSPGEIRIVPKELQYEMFRSTKQDQNNRNDVDYWFDYNYACVDSLIFLYFLQYKVSRCQGKLKDQEMALTRLALATVTEANLGHRETAWNLLGQCLEYEKKSRGALHCYALSLRIRQQNNAARILICRLLSRKINKRMPAKHAETK